MMLIRFGSVLAVLLICLVPALPQILPSREDLAGLLREEPLNNEPVSDLAERNDLGTLQIIAANWDLSYFDPQTREKILLPTAHLMPEGPREGIVVNVAEYRLYYFKNGRLAFTAPVGLGHEGHDTPLGETKVIGKKKNPSWYPTPGTRVDFPELPAVVPPGPENPLGAYALYLGWPLYRIHGAIDSYSIGRRFTRGCVRLYAPDIEALFNMVPVGTPVTMTDQPVKIGWHQDELFIEAHPDFDQLEELRVYGHFTLKSAENIRDWILAAAGGRANDLNWFSVNEALARRSGVPTQITRTTTHPVDITDHGLSS